MVSTLNETSRHEAASDETSLINLLVDRARQAGSAPALFDRGRWYSYEQIVRASSAWCSEFDACSVQRPDTVFCSRPVDIWTVALLVACLDRGLRLCFLDGDAPSTRLADQTARVGDGWFVGDRAADLGRESTLIPHPHVDLYTANAGTRVSLGTGDEADARIVYFTSGSEGTPKAVQVSHGNIVNRLTWMWSAYPFEANDVLGIQKPPFFVASFWEYLGGLLRGIPSVIFGPDDRADPLRMVDAIASHKVTHLFLTPPQLRSINEECHLRGQRLEQLRLVTSGADVLPPKVAIDFRSTAPSARLLNLYGATETASNSAAFDTSKLDPKLDHVPVGLPIDGARIAVRDRWGRELPSDVAGRVCVAGALVADGYLGASHEGFVSGHEPEFRSGDRGYLDQAGVLHLLGRSDNVVKVRGYSVNLEEVENALAGIDGVTDSSVVLAVVDDRPTLTALVVGDSANLRSVLSERLPAYMVPAVIHPVTSLPRLSNGKRDRARASDVARDLLSRERERSLSRDSTPRRGSPRDQKIREIWCSELPFSRSPEVDDFFEVGGDSLTAVRLLNRVAKETGQRVSLRQFYTSPQLSVLFEVALTSDEASDV